MASGIHMPGPVCLIENSSEQLLINQKALEILSSIQKPVVVVAIVGLYCTGKSYPMNKLAGKQKGFSLGSTVQSHTKGIWMWCVPHPQNPEHTVVLLDTEGLEDTVKGDNQNDCWISALAVLLSSSFIYNSMGRINQQAMDQLHYVTELSNLIKSKSSCDQSDVDDSTDFVDFFPIFVWALRDFCLDLDIDGTSISADDYLEISLALRKGTEKKTKRFNEPRLCIRKFFPTRKCFIFDRPADRKQLSKLEFMQEEPNKEFVEQVANFTSYIFRYSGVKTLSGGILVNGPCLKSLVQTFVSAINSGELPCMESAVMTSAQIENTAAVQKAITHYEEQMNQKIQMPTENLQELLDLHRTCVREALVVFMKNSFKDVDQKFQTEFEGQLEAKQDAFVKKNMDTSSARCSDLLKSLFGPLEDEVKQGTFYKPGGYYLFIHKERELVKKYNQTPGKGLQAEVMLRKYLESKEDVVDTLLKMEQTHIEKEKQIEVEHIKAEAAEAAKRALEEMPKKHELLMEQKEKSFQEHLKQLTEKMEQEWKELMAERERILSLKLQRRSHSRAPPTLRHLEPLDKEYLLPLSPNNAVQEQERLLKEGFLNQRMKLLKKI